MMAKRALSGRLNGGRAQTTFDIARYDAVCENRRDCEHRRPEGENDLILAAVWPIGPAAAARAGAGPRRANRQPRDWRRGQIYSRKCKKGISRSLRSVYIAPRNVTRPAANPPPTTDSIINKLRFIKYRIPIEPSDAAPHVRSRRRRVARAARSSANHNSHCAGTVCGR